MQKQISPKIVALTFGVLVVSFLAVFYVVAWTEPGQNPPGCTAGDPGCDAPINVSDTEQIKTGPLQVNGFRNIGNTVLDSNVGIGTTGLGYKLSVFDSASNAWIQVKGQSVSGAFSGIRIGSDEATDKEYILEHRSDNAFWVEYNDGINPYYTRMVIDSSGRVGIGTPSPGYKLDVQGGQINASGGLCIGGDCRTSWPTGGFTTCIDGPIQSYTNNTSWPGTIITLTCSPGYKAHWIRCYEDPSYNTFTSTLGVSSGGCYVPYGKTAYMQITCCQ